LTVVIGRADALSGVFPDVDLSPYGAEAAGISRQHARLTLKDDQYWIEDLNSVNLTYLNDQRLTPDRPVRLKDGDLIRLGRLLVTFRAG
jgi:pSer/pThr/pTyr-binding forkhead associated (FHA) protein